MPFPFNLRPGPISILLFALSFHLSEQVANSQVPNAAPQEEKISEENRIFIRDLYLKSIDRPPEPREEETWNARLKKVNGDKAILTELFQKHIKAWLNNNSVPVYFGCTPKELLIRANDPGEESEPCGYSFKQILPEPNAEPVIEFRAFVRPFESCNVPICKNHIPNSTQQYGICGRFPEDFDELLQVDPRLQRKGRMGYGCSRQYPGTAQATGYISQVVSDGKTNAIYRMTPTEVPVSIGGKPTQSAPIKNLFLILP